jgi:hypothetical protein
VLGFVPAAYHALRMGARDLHQIREQQEILSRKPGHRGDQPSVREPQRRREERQEPRAADHRPVWVMFTGGALFGWYRTTS